MHDSAEWGARRWWKAAARVEEVPALFSAQNALNEGARADSQELPRRDFCSWIVHDKEPTKLADQTELMSACRLGPLAALRDVGTHYIEGDDRIGSF
jgi:hypothetical protein